MYIEHKGSGHKYLGVVALRICGIEKETGRLWVRWEAGITRLFREALVRISAEDLSILEAYHDPFPFYFRQTEFPLFPIQLVAGVGLDIEDRLHLFDAHLHEIGPLRQPEPNRGGRGTEGGQCSL